MKNFYANNIQTYVGVDIPAGSTCILTLSGNAVSLVGNVVAQTRYSIPIDGTGSFAQEILFTDEMNPSGLGYNIQIRVPNVGFVYDQKNVPITGASFNLASFVPGSQGAAAFGITFPTFETNGTANTDQQVLNIKAGSNITVTADGVGGVTIAAPPAGDTSVGLVDSTGTFVITNSPITSAGNLTLSAFASQTQNTFLAAPNGSNGASAFRTIAVADVPTLNQSTTGSAASLSISGQTGLLTVTGLTSFSRTKTVGDTTDTLLELSGSYTPTGTWTSMTLVTPALGTPASGTLTHCTGLPAANIVAGTMASGMVLVAPALGTPASGTLTNCTFPTLNQSTTGSAASLSISGQTALLTVTGLTSTNRIKTVRDAADTILELGGSYTPTGTWTSMTLATPALGTPASGNLNNCVFGVASTTAGVVTLEGSTSGTATITAPAVAGTNTNPITFSNSISLPVGTSLNWNNDTFISRGFSPAIYIGNSVGGTNGQVYCSAVYTSILGLAVNGDTGITRDSATVFDFGAATQGSKTGTINAAAININGATATFGTAGTTSGVLTLEGSASGSCTITAPATAGTAANAITFSNSIQIPSATAFNWNADLFLSRMGANSLGVGNGVGNSNGALSAGGITCGGTTSTASLAVSGATATFGTAGSVSGVLTLRGSTSNSCTITAPAVAGTVTNAVVFSNNIQANGGLFQPATDGAGILAVKNNAGTFTPLTINTAGSSTAVTCTAADSASTALYCTGGTYALQVVSGGIACVSGAKLAYFNGAATAGNGFPVIYNAIKVTAQAANYNAGSAASLVVTPIMRVSGSQMCTRAATNSSTFPSLTLAWTDVGGIARTLVLVTSDSNNATTDIQTFSAVIYTNNSTAPTLTSASYASSGATSMQYALCFNAEALN